MHLEAYVRGIAVHGPADVDPHAVYIQHVTGADGRCMVGQAQVIGRQGRAESVLPLHDRDGTVEGSTPCPSAERHALYGAGCIGVVVGVAVGYDDGVCSAEVVADALHLCEGPGAGIHMEATPVMLDQKASAATGLVHGSVPSSARSQERDMESHARSSLIRIYRSV